MSNTFPLGEQIGVRYVGATTPIPVTQPSDFPDFTMPSEWVDNLRFDSNLQKWTDANGDTLHEGAYFPSWYQGTELDVQANWLKKVNTVIWCEPDRIATAQQELLPYVGVITGSFPANAYSSYAFFNDTYFPTFRVTDANRNHQITIPSSYNVYTFVYWCDNDPLVNLNVDSTELTYTAEQNVSTLAPMINNFKKDEWAVFVFGTRVEVIVTTNLGDYYHNSGKIQFSHNLTGIAPQPKPFMSIPPIVTNESLKYTLDNGMGAILQLTAPQEIGNADGGIPWEFQGWYFSTTSAWSGGTQTLPTDYYSQSLTCDVILLYSKIVMTAIYAPSSNYYTITYYSGLPEPA